MPVSALVKQTAQACVLSAISNVLAQIITAYNESKPIGPQSFAVRPIIDFVFFAILNTPPNALWQEWLEHTFPGSKPRTEPKKKDDPNGLTDEKVMKESNVQGGLDVKNTLTKFALDQTIGAIGNTVLFYVGMGAIQGQNWEQIRGTMEREAVGLWIDGLKLWLPVSVINFTVLPVQQRVLFGALAGMVWGVYLSLMAT